MVGDESQVPSFSGKSDKKEEKPAEAKKDGAEEKKEGAEEKKVAAAETDAPVEVANVQIRIYDYDFWNQDK